LLHGEHVCDKPTLYHSNNTGNKDQHKFIHKLIQCDDIHFYGRDEFTYLSVTKD